MIEWFKGKSLNVYGFNLPKVKSVGPTGLLWLEDDSVAILDYESSYKQENKVKYLEYVARVVDRYYSKYKTKLKIRVLVIYTADVKKEQAINSLDLGAATLKVEQVFLSDMDSEKIKENLGKKIRSGEPLTDEEMMQFIILPLACKGKRKKNEMIRTLLSLSRDVKDEATQIFLLSGVLLFTDKVIDEKLAEKMKEWIGLTKVARLFEEEKQQEIAQERQQTTINLLKNNASIEFIMNIVPLTRKEIEKIQSELEEERKTEECQKG